MCGVVDVCFVDAKEAENEENPGGKRVSEGIDCGIKDKTNRIFWDSILMLFV